MKLNEMPTFPLMCRVSLYYFYPCQCFVYMRADYIFYRLPLIMRCHELNRSLRYLLISGSTWSKKIASTYDLGQH